MTTLGQLKAGDEILTIKNTPAAKVTAGIPWTNQPQRLIVTKVALMAGHATIWFDNGGRLLPVDAKTPCTVANA